MLLFERGLSDLDPRDFRDLRSELSEQELEELLAASFGGDGSRVFALKSALEESRDRRLDADLDALTVAKARDILLAPGAAAWARRHRDALGSECIAAIAKVMTSDELSTVARVMFNPVADAGAALRTAGAASRAPAYAASRGPAD